MYTLVMDSRAESDLARLSRPITQRIRQRLEKLCQDPDNEHHGHSGERFPTALAVGGKPANSLCLKT